MLDSLQTTSGVIYYKDFELTRTNFRYLNSLYENFSEQDNFKQN